MRLGLAIVLAAAMGTLAALIAGEYELKGIVPLVAAAFIGFGLGELIAAVGRDHGPIAQVAAGGLSAACLAWAAWIASGEGLLPIPTITKFSPLIAAVVAVVTVRGGASKEHSSDVSATKEPN